MTVTAPELPPQENLSGAPLESDPGILDMLEAKWAKGKFLCVGLDVTPDEGSDGPLDLYDKARLIVDATKDIAAAYKPNSAFYERQGSSGVAQLEQLVGYIKKLAPSIPVIWDAKRADIANTNNGYDKVVENLGADAITIHPYLGGTAVQPLLTNPKRAGFVLAHTSNPGAAEFQHLELKSGELLWEHVVTNVAHSEDWKHGSMLGIVTGATYPEELAKARYLAGDEVVMLVPGIGKQGGDLEASVRGAMNSRHNGFLINVSSDIGGAKDESGKVTLESVREAALKYDTRIKAIWEDAIANPTPNYEQRYQLEFNAKLASALFDSGCIKFGNYTLTSGRVSPVYVNLRASQTDPVLRGSIANIYVDLIKGLEKARGEQFDVIGGIPQAATSYAAIVAERMTRRLVQPRTEPKDHGMGNLVDGVFSEGETIGLIDDLITDGGSKFAAMDMIEKAGLAVGGLAVLVDREQGGFREMARKGRAISSATTLRALINELAKTNKIPEDTRSQVLEYLQT